MLDLYRRMNMVTNMYWNGTTDTTAHTVTTPFSTVRQLWWRIWMVFAEDGILKRESWQDFGLYQVYGCVPSCGDFFSDGMDHYCTFPTTTIGDTYDGWRDPRVPIVDVRAVVLFHRQIMTPERTQFNAVTRLVLSRYVNTGTYCMLTCRTRVILNNTS